MRRVRAVAERLGGAAAAAAQVRRGDARDDPPGAADDLEVAAHLKRSVGLRVDRERPVAPRAACRCACSAARRSPRSRPRGASRRRRACSWRRRSGTAWRESPPASPSISSAPRKAYGPASRTPARFTGGSDLVRLPVAAAVADRPRGAGVRDVDQPLDPHRVGMDPRPLHVGEEHLRGERHAEARVDAALALVDEVELLAARSPRHPRPQPPAAGGAGGGRGGARRPRGRAQRSPAGRAPARRPRAVRARRAVAAAACARASPAAASSAPASASCAKRSTNSRRAARPGRQRARIAQRDEGHAGVAVRVRRPRRQARGALGERQHRAHQADRQVHDQGLLGARPAQRVGVGEQPQHQPVAAFARSTVATAVGFSSHTRPSGRGGRRSTGLVAAGNAGAKCGIARAQRAQLGADAEELLVVRVRPSRAARPRPARRSRRRRRARSSGSSPASRPRD